jgi:hypothetical protein
MSYAGIFRFYLKSVLNITVRQRCQSALYGIFYNLKKYVKNSLINSSKAWNVNFNNGNDNYNNKSNKNYVRCVRGR